MKNSLVIIGAGGHALTLIQMIKAIGTYDILGLVDPRYEVGSSVSGVSVLGDDKILEGKEFHNTGLVIGVGITKGDALRKNLYNKFRSLGYKFPIICDSRAVIAENAVINDGVQVMPNVVIQPSTTIGRNTIVNTSTVIEHQCIIGEHSHIAPGVVIGGNVHIGDCTMIGLGARILPGLRIGDEVTVGAGAVVTRDVRNGATVVGVPAKEMHD